MLIAPVTRREEVQLDGGNPVIIEEGGFAPAPGEVVIRIRLRYSGGLAPILTRRQLPQFIYALRAIPVGLLC